MDDVLIERDARTGATYLVLDEADVARTVHVADLISVDLAADGHEVGVEFAFRGAPAHDDWVTLFNAFPHLKETLSHISL